MSDLVKKMKIMQWWKTLPFAKNIQLSWSDKSKKGVWAIAYYARRTIVLYNIFDCTFESVQRCVLHEAAHIVQHDTMGYSKHDANFQMINEQLLMEFGTPEIINSKLSGTIATSSYKRD